MDYLEYDSIMLLWIIFIFSLKLLYSMSNICYLFFVKITVHNKITEFCFTHSSICFQLKVGKFLLLILLLIVCRNKELYTGDD